MKKLVRKVVSRDTLNYRKLTDKPVSKDSEDTKPGEQTDEQKEGEGDGGEDKMETEEVEQEGLALGKPARKPTHVVRLMLRWAVCVPQLRKSH